jgi:hypothetical protein
MNASGYSSFAVPLENTIAGNFPLPGFEPEECGFCMFGADECCPAPETLEPDSRLTAIIAFLVPGHGDHRLDLMDVHLFAGLFRIFREK